MNQQCKFVLLATWLNCWPYLKQPLVRVEWTISEYTWRFQGLFSKVFKIYFWELSKTLKLEFSFTFGSRFAVFFINVRDMSFKSTNWPNSKLLISSVIVYARKMKMKILSNRLQSFYVTIDAIIGSTMKFSLKNNPVSSKRKTRMFV